ncbi:MULTISPECIES: hypothetical protein [Pseudomonas]|uniref:hypothetical protein n=1 Tax=Pseudomonas TaxID=286 RepID=UPI0002A16784|nr:MULTISPECIES: hypothetical protein [Pseudomonas]AGA72608.1 hypothetical protein B479_08480 [Pseudomonas putida HB3267]MCE0755327.1 hypothetical protein [Pseudomonas asiatica]MCE0944068.1 hypothetical protein [Pseudomonas asiatica]MCE0956039.1 hypothetical protein [Pseudomonas asiatica]MCE1031084.1 hypothetical protein [Pseudomonas asiatica]
MRPVAVFWACLTAAAFAFWIGVVLTIYATNHRVAQADEQYPPPPAGDQFDEGPVLARVPVTQLYPVRFIF